MHLQTLRAFFQFNSDVFQVENTFFLIDKYGVCQFKLLTVIIPERRRDWDMAQNFSANLENSNMIWKIKKVKQNLTCTHEKKSAAQDTISQIFLKINQI